MDSKHLIFNFQKRKRGASWVGLLLLLVLITSLTLALVNEILSTVAQSKKAGQLQIAQSLCDAGLEKAVWKLNQPTGTTYTGENDLDLGTGVVDISVTTVDSATKTVTADCYVPAKTNYKQKRTVRAKLSAEFNETGAAFHYGIQVGGLGITLSPNAKVNGSIYSAGNIDCSNNVTITGDAFGSKDINGGGFAKIDNCNIGGNASAHTIEDSRITGTAASVVWTRSSATGGRTAISPQNMKPYLDLPISQSTIDIWKGWASDGGTHIGNYRLTTGAIGSIGPKKIQGNLILDSGSVLTLTGIIWVEGDIILNTGSTVNLSSAYGPNSGMIIADYPTDRANRGVITVNSNVNINGSGNPKSYILMLSTNTRSTTAAPAIFAGNNSNAVVYYTTEGMIEVNNNARLRALSGGGIHISNGAEVSYDTGLADANFSAGPGGSWVLKDWQIIY